MVDAGVWQPNNPNNYNIYAGITRHGPTPVHQVAGSTCYKHQYHTKAGKDARNITSDEYRDVLWNTFLPAGARLFNTSRWYLQQDNDPTHRIAVQVVKDWNTMHNSDVQVLSGYPPNSPDLNLIENFWSYVERRVFDAGCCDLVDFKACVKEQVGIWGPERKSYITKLYSSMPKRLAMVIAKNGGKSGY